MALQKWLSAGLLISALSLTVQPALGAPGPVPGKEAPRPGDKLKSDDRNEAGDTVDIGYLSDSHRAFRMLKQEKPRSKIRASRDGLPEKPAPLEVYEAIVNP